MSGKESTTKLTSTAGACRALHYSLLHRTFPTLQRQAYFSFRRQMQLRQNFRATADAWRQVTEKLVPGDPPSSVIQHRPPVGLIRL